MFKKEKPCEAGWAHAVLLALAIGSAHGAPSGRLDLDGVQEGSQGLPEGPAERKDTGAGAGCGRRLPRPACPAPPTGAAAPPPRGRSSLSPGFMFSPTSYTVFHRGGL